MKYQENSSSSISEPFNTLEHIEMFSCYCSKDLNNSLRKNSINEINRDEVSPINISGALLDQKVSWTHHVNDIQT